MVADGYDEIITYSFTDPKENELLVIPEGDAKYNFVKRLIIFGSAVTKECSEDSDVDICIDIIGDTKGLHTYQMNVDLSKACNHNLDILTYNKLQGKIKDEVEKKGVVVYELS